MISELTRLEKKFYLGANILTKSASLNNDITRYTMLATGHRFNQLWKLQQKLPNITFWGSPTIAESAEAKGELTASKHYHRSRRSVFFSPHRGVSVNSKTKNQHLHVLVFIIVLKILLFILEFPLLHQ